MSKTPSEPSGHAKMTTVVRSMLTRTGALAVGVVLVAGGCSGGEEEAGQRADPVVVSTPSTTPPGDGEAPTLFDLSTPGSHGCVDEEGDVTVAAETQAPPPVDLPGLDLVEAGVEVDEEHLRGSFRMVGAADPATDAEYVVFVGLLDDMSGFELRVVQLDEVWVLELHRGQGTIEGAPIPTASVTVEGPTVAFETPLDEIPLIAPNQPVNYGTTGSVVDADGQPLDREGAPADPDDGPAQAIDDCLFG